MNIESVFKNGVKNNSFNFFIKLGQTHLFQAYLNRFFFRDILPDKDAPIKYEEFDAYTRKQICKFGPDENARLVILNTDYLNDREERCASDEFCNIISRDGTRTYLPWMVGEVLPFTDRDGNISILRANHDGSPHFGTRGFFNDMKSFDMFVYNDRYLDCVAKDVRLSDPSERYFINTEYKKCYLPEFGYHFTKDGKLIDFNGHNMFNDEMMAFCGEFAPTQFMKKVAIDKTHSRYEKDPDSPHVNLLPIYFFNHGDCFYDLDSGQFFDTNGKEDPKLYEVLN